MRKGERKTELLRGSGKKERNRASESAAAGAYRHSELSNLPDPARGRVTVSLLASLHGRFNPALARKRAALTPLGRPFSELLLE